MNCRRHAMNVQVTPPRRSSRPTHRSWRSPTATSIRSATATTDLYPYLEQRWQEHLQTFGSAPAPGLPGRAGLSEGPAERLAPRRLAAGGRPPGQQPAVHAEAAAGCQQHRARHPERRPATTGQASRTASSAPRSAAPPTTGRWRNGCRRSRGCSGSIVVPYEDAEAAVPRDRTLGRRPAFRPGADADPHRRAARARDATGRSTRPPPRPTCRSACTRSATAAIPSPAAAGRPSTSRTWSATRSPASRCSPAW